MTDGAPIQSFYSTAGRVGTCRALPGPRVPTSGTRTAAAMSTRPAARWSPISAMAIITSSRRSRARRRPVPSPTRTAFVSDANEAFSERLAELCGPGLDRAFFTSGGSEAIEASLKFARQAAWVRGERQRWKVISRDPSYHGSTLGALAVTGDEEAEEIFGPMMARMPKVPAPFTYRVPNGLSAESWQMAAAQELEEVILREGPEILPGLHPGAGRRTRDRGPGGGRRLLRHRAQDLLAPRAAADLRRSHERRRPDRPASFARSTGRKPSRIWLCWPRGWGRVTRRWES